ncbi:MAG: hypothetical protein GVX78_03900 [Bacteroidetes bacterium]|jgi:alkaline phosphatase|nr:hypothetical protein [Bacteroidota bacterium]
MIFARRYLFIYIIWFLPILICGQSQHLSVHSHNDYRRETPLYTAWESGVQSVEADVHLYKGRLYVSHSRPIFFSDRKTLKNLYLKPLFSQIMKNESNATYTKSKDLPPFLLWIDIKGNFDTVYQVLLREIEPYKAQLSRVENEKIVWGPVMIILSGNRDIAKLEKETTRWVFTDGRSRHMGCKYPFHFMPVISDHYDKLIKQDSEKDSKRELLINWTRRVHNEGKWSRLWAAPDHPMSWKRQWEAGMSFINTDQPARLAEIIRVTQSNATSPKKYVPKSMAPE